MSAPASKADNASLSGNKIDFMTTSQLHLSCCTLIATHKSLKTRRLCFIGMAENHHFLVARSQLFQEFGHFRDARLRAGIVHFLTRP